MRRRSAITIALAAALASTACAGPRAPLAVRVREIPSDVVLGGARGIAPVVPVPPVALPTRGPALAGLLDDPADVAPPPLRRDTARPSECPAADPRGAAVEAPITVTLPPAPGTYAYRSGGTYETTGAGARKGSFPSSQARTVANVVSLAGGEQRRYRFEVLVTLGSWRTTTAYTLVTESASPTATEDGLFLTAVESEMPDGSAFRFEPMPSPGLLVLPFPAVPGTTWTARGFDPANGTAMAYSGTVGQRERIDACGVLLDAISVRLDGTVGPQAAPGIAVSPEGRDEFRADYAFGTQFGGLILEDTVSVARQSPGGNLVATTNAVISRRPVPPAAPAGSPS